MKGHKQNHHHSRKHKADGGEARGDAVKGANEWEEDLKDKPMRYTQGRPEDEAEEKKRGGRAKRKHGGAAMPKCVGSVHGIAAKHHAGRKPRKSGGRAGSDMHPFSSARAGSPPAYHKDTLID
jgi:hypothetical protein